MPLNENEGGVVYLLLKSSHTLFAEVQVIPNFTPDP